jgi:hypothetical protein
MLENSSQDYQELAEKHTQYVLLAQLIAAKQNVWDA